MAGIFDYMSLFIQMLLKDVANKTRQSSETPTI